MLLLSVGSATYLTSQVGCMLLSHIQQLLLLRRSSFTTLLLKCYDALPTLVQVLNPQVFPKSCKGAQDCPCMVTAAPVSVPGLCDACLNLFSAV